jgi:hypothetical protein
VVLHHGLTINAFWLGCNETQAKSDTTLRSFCQLNSSQSNVIVEWRRLRLTVNPRPGAPPLAAQLGSTVRVRNLGGGWSTFRTLNSTAGGKKTLGAPSFRVLCERVGGPVREHDGSSLNETRHQKNHRSSAFDSSR